MHYSVTVAVQPGLYEIQHSSSLNFLDALEAPVYNGVSDDALNLVQSPSRLGKVSSLSTYEDRTLIA